MLSLPPQKNPFMVLCFQYIVIKHPAGEQAEDVGFSDSCSYTEW